MSVLQILLLIVLIPVGLYLRELAYSSIRRPNRLFEDIESLIRSVKQWRERRAYRKELKRKYGHLNKPKK